jgi:hypothetical protein
MLVPVIIAAIPAVMTKNILVFTVGFPILMVLCNIVTIACICLITEKVYANKKRAYIAGMMYATSIYIAYTTLTNFDSLPTMLLMIGLTCTIYGGEKLKSYGYIAYILGFFTKIFPIAVLPFAVIYNAKKSSLTQEVKNAAFDAIVPFAILFVPFVVLNRASIDTYLISNATSKGVFADSLVYAMNAWVSGAMKIPVSVDVISAMMSVLLVITMGSLIYLAYKAKSDAILLLSFTAIALVAIIAFSKYRSPQYMMWFTPILCILVAGNLRKMGVYYLLQFLWYLKFPLLFYVLYTNGEYTNPVGSWLWYAAALFFTVEYIILFYMVWLATEAPIRRAIGDVK